MGKSPIKIFPVVVAGIVAVYIIICLIFSIVLNETLTDIYNSASFESLETVIQVDEEAYNYMKSLYLDHKDDTDSYDYEATFPVSIVWFNGVKSYFNYTYILYDSDGETIAGCKDIDTWITVKFIDGRFVLVKSVESI